MSLRLAVVALLIIACLVSVGCSDQPYYPVRGKVVDEAGQPLKELAGAQISFKPVAITTSLLKHKLGAKNHSDLIRIAVEMGLD